LLETSPIGILSQKPLKKETPVIEPNPGIVRILSITAYSK